MMYGKPHIGMYKILRKLGIVSQINWVKDGCFSINSMVATRSSPSIFIVVVLRWAAVFSIRESHPNLVLFQVGE